MGVWKVWSLGMLVCMACAGTWAQTPGVRPPADGPRAGTFKHVQGETWVGSPANRQQPVPGDGLRVAEPLNTGPDGAASILLKDGTVLTVGPNSTVDLRRFQFDATTQEGHFALDLIKGSVRVVTGLLARMNPDLFKVHTPTSVVGVRGTDFIVEVPETTSAPAPQPTSSLINGFTSDPSALASPGPSGCAG
ncbi:MAG: FecR family protein [Hydrogenophaga sp.]|jgi:hypothetical protein|nr:FecR family protein [Hydrogenophaga sp.]